MSVTAFNIKPNNKVLVFDANFIKQNFLFGVNLKDDDGNEMPESLFEFFILAAQHWIERELNIYLTPTVVKNEAHDYYFSDYSSFNFIRLFRYPVRKVSKITMQFPMSTNVIEFNPEWFRVESSGGQVNLLPTQGTLSQIFLSEAGSYLPYLYAARSYLPHTLFVDYEAGFEKDNVPSDILEVIGMKGSFGPLNLAGDLVGGAAIASKSLSMDGLSQSINTTSSPSFSGYGARLLQYHKQIEMLMTQLRGAYRGIQMVVG